MTVRTCVDILARLAREGGSENITWVEHWRKLGLYDGKAFWTEGSTNAKALSQDHDWCVQGAVEKVGGA